MLCKASMYWKELTPVSFLPPLQTGGIRFLYDNIVESLEQFKTSNGFGCILAHSMGLGKTLQVGFIFHISHMHTQ